MRVFYISTDPTNSGHKFWFPVYIYETVGQLQTAARKYRRHEDVNNYWDNALACFHPKTTIGVDKKGKYYRVDNTNCIGVMRLTIEDLTMRVIIHESTHAAISLVNALFLKYGYMIGNSNIETEEALCHSVDEISTAIIQHLAVKQ